MQELEDSIVLHGHTGDGASACPYQETGLQIWWPAAYWHNDNESRRNDYANLEFDDTLWDEFLAEYD